MRSALMPSGGFRKMFSFGYACLVYHATTTFCKRFFPWKEDPLGKTSGQMVGAARSARQNIFEASARAGTSKETELRLLDVAKGSLAELQGDYEAFLTDAYETIWPKDDPRRKELAALNLDEFPLSVLNRLFDGRGNFIRLAVTPSDPTLTVTNDHQRRETKTATTFDNRSAASNLHYLVNQFARNSFS